MYQISHEKQLEIQSFLSKYLKKYPQVYQEAIQDYLFDGISGYDFLIQLYSYFDAIEGELDPYIQFSSLIMEKINNIHAKKIVEVGAGIVPILSYKLSEKNNLENSIDVYDPNLLPLSLNNMVLHKRAFTIYNRVPADLYIAQCPCEALKTIVDKSIKHKREMVVQTCHCCKEIPFYSRSEFYYYIDFLMYQLEQLTDSGFIVEKEFLSCSRMIDAPIILARKKS